MAVGHLTARWRRRLRRRATLIARVCFVLAALIVVVGVAAFVNGRRQEAQGGSSDRAGAPDQAGSPSGVSVTQQSTASTVPPTLSTSAAAGAAVLAQLPTTTTTRATTRTTMVSRNTAPSFIGPTQVSVEHEGETPLEGLGLMDAEAASGVGDLGVLAYSPLGRMRFGDVSGVVLHTENATNWIPMTGTVDGVNRALRSLSYLPGPSRAEHTIWLLASDFGHGVRSNQLLAQRTINVTVER